MHRIIVLYPSITGLVLRSDHSTVTEGVGLAEKAIISMGKDNYVD